MIKPKMPIAWGGIENRVFARYAVDCAVTVTSGTETSTAAVRNISEGGLFIASAEPAERGSIVSVTVRLPGAHNDFFESAEVRWVRVNEETGKAGLGVSFTSLSPESRGIITHFMSGKSPL